MDAVQLISVAAAGIVPTLALVGIWVSISTRLTKVESDAGAAKDIASIATEKLFQLDKSTSSFREEVARDYINCEAMKTTEDRLTRAIDRLGDRLDRFLDTTAEK
jgi:hypothetical protein